jgi:hypothetical protein
VLEIGYIAADGRWLLLAQSTPVRIPPVYPSDWVDDQFVTIDWDEELRGKTFLQLVHPARRYAEITSASYGINNIFETAQRPEAQHVAGSVFGSAQMVPEESISSYVFPSGIGKWAEKTASGVGMYTTSGAGIAARSESGVGMYTTSGAGLYGGMSGVGMYTTSGIGGYTTSGVGMYTTSGMGIAARSESGVGMYTTSGAGLYGMSGVGMSGVGMYTTSGMGMSGIGMSGVGFSASMPPIRPRQFWLIADAELIVYGATEPDATVTIAGRPIKLNPDGTFRFQMSFQDGLIDFPIMAVAADGEQTRSVHLKFTRETPERNTNTKEEAVPEWLPQ